MKEDRLKIAIGILAFVIGISCTAVWFVYPHSLNQMLEIASSDALVIEETEEYAVYSAAINELYVKKDFARLLVISKQTSYYGDERHKAIYGDDYIKIKTAEQRVRHMKVNYPSVNEETLFDYDAKMMKPHKLNSNFNISVAYNLTSENNYEKDNVIRLSKVGFNKKANQAFVYIEFLCLVMCSRSDYLLLERVDGKWKINEVFRSIRS